MLKYLISHTKSTLTAADEFWSQAVHLVLSLLVALGYSHHKSVASLPEHSLVEVEL